MTGGRDKRTRVNRDIRAPEVRVIDHNGEQVGVMSAFDAQRMASDVELDLVEISPNANPPVCRIMDYGKYLFDQKKKKAKSKQKSVQIKEVKFRPNTDQGDYNVKLKKIRGFIEGDHKVKITLRFRGREMQHKQLGMDLLQRIYADLGDAVVVEQHPKLEGRQMSMLVAQNRNIAKVAKQEEGETEENAENED